MREAAQRLGVSNSKIWRLVKEGILPVQRNPLDGREKRVRLIDLERLETGRRPRPIFLSDGVGDNPNAVPSDRIEEDLRDRWQRPC